MIRVGRGGDLYSRAGTRHSVPFSFLVLAYVLVIYPLDRLIYLSKAMPSAYPALTSRVCTIGS